MLTMYDDVAKLSDDVDDVCLEGGMVYGRGGFDLEQFVAVARAAGTDLEQVEVKAAVQGLPKDIAQTVSAFANTSGGHVVCGISEQDGFVPAQGFDAKGIQDAIANICAEKVEPPVRARIDIVPFEGSVVVVAEIPETPPHAKPCYVKARSLYDGSFVRVGDGDRRLSRYEVDRVLEMRGQPRHDITPVAEALSDDLDAEIVEGYLARMRALSPRIFGKLSDQDALLSTHVLVRDPEGVIRPTLAGLVAMGAHPQEFFPRLNVTFAAFPGTSKAVLGESGMRFIDSKSLRGPIPVLIAEALALIRKNTMTASYMVGASRIDAPDYPEVAVREALANALMHRDYSPQGCSASVQVNLFTDRLEILNPGGLFGGVTVDRLGEYGISASRNQFLSDILEATQYPIGYPETGCVVENKGTGYAQIELALSEAGMQPPVARDSIASFSLTIYKGRAAAPVAMRVAAPRANAGGQAKASAALKVSLDQAGAAPQASPTLASAAAQVPDRGSVTSGTTNIELDDGDVWIVEWVVQNGSVQTPDVAEALGVSRATALRRLNALCDRGVLIRDGKPRSPLLRYRLA